MSKPVITTELPLRPLSPTEWTNWMRDHVVANDSVGWPQHICGFEYADNPKEAEYPEVVWPEGEAT